MSKPLGPEAPAHSKKTLKAAAAVFKQKTSDFIDRHSKSVKLVREINQLAYTDILTKSDHQGTCVGMGKLFRSALSSDNKSMNLGDFIGAKNASLVGAALADQDKYEAVIAKRNTAAKNLGSAGRKIIHSSGVEQSLAQLQKKESENFLERTQDARDAWVGEKTYLWGVKQCLSGSRGRILFVWMNNHYMHVWIPEGDSKSVYFLDPNCSLLQIEKKSFDAVFSDYFCEVRKDRDTTAAFLLSIDFKVEDKLAFYLENASIDQAIGNNNSQSSVPQIRNSDSIPSSTRDRSKVVTSAPDVTE